MTDPRVARPALSSAWLLLAVLGTAVNLRSAVTSVGALLPEVQAALGMSALRAGILTSLPVVSFGVVALLSNLIARRLGLTRALTLATAAIATGLLLRVAIADSTWLLTTSLLVLSGIAVGNVLLPVAVRAWFPERVGPTTGWYAIALSLGTGMPAALAVPLAAALGGWRPGLAIWALPATVAVVPWIMAERAGPVRAGPSSPAASPDTARRPAELRERTGSSPSLRAGSAGPSPPRPAPVHRRLQSWALAVFFGLQSLEAYVIMGWLPSILRDADVSADLAGAMLGVAMIVGGPVALLLPRVAGRTDDQRVFVLGLVLLSAAGYVGLLLAPAAWPLLWTVLLGLGLGAFPLALLLLGIRSATPQGTAALSSLTQGVGYLIAALGPVTIGVLREGTGGWTVPLLVLVVLLVPKLLAGLVAASPGQVDVAGSGPGRRDVLRGFRADPAPPPTP